MTLERSDMARSAAALGPAGYELVVVSKRDTLDRLELCPFGVAVTPIDGLAPRGFDVRAFISVYQRLNALAFGDIAMPKWMIFDVILMSSALVLVVRDPEELRTMSATMPGGERIQVLLETAAGLGYEGPIPVAGYCADPTLVDGEWSGFSLCSLVRGLGTVTKAIAMEVYRARSLIGVTQYSNPALRIHRKFGRMRLLAARVDVHEVPGTLVYRSDLYAADDDDEPTFWLDPRDNAEQDEMQKKIESSASEYYVVSPGAADGRIPIREAAL